MWLPDALRGLALLNMLAYHALYDWVYVFGHTGGWYNISAPGCHLWQQYICWSFILLSGFSLPLARRPVRNGLLVAACAALLTAATVLFLPSESIWFGVLHLNATAALLTCLVRPLLQRIPAKAAWRRLRRCLRSRTSCRRDLSGLRVCGSVPCLRGCTGPTCSGSACLT